jgi:hypothetical protein
MEWVRELFQTHLDWKQKQGFTRDWGGMKYDIIDGKNQNRPRIKG